MAEDNQTLEFGGRPRVGVFPSSLCAGMEDAPALGRQDAMAGRGPPRRLDHTGHENSVFDRWSKGEAGGR